MQIEELEIGKIKPYEKNPRKNDAAVNGVAESIKQFGFKQPIVIDKNNVIVAGHTRYKAAKKLGLETIPCVRANDLTKEQVKAYRIADNKLNELATWDFVALDEELASFDFDFEPFEFELPDFDVTLEEDEVEPTVAPVPSPAAETVGAPPAKMPSNGAVASCEVFHEEELAALPEECQDVDLTATPIKEIKGDDKTLLDRVIIVFPKERVAEVCGLLGLDALGKTIYDIDELRRNGERSDV